MTDKTPAPLRVLFIGNSQVNCVCNIPKIVEDLSRSAPAGARGVVTDQVVIGGASFEILWNDSRPTAKIRAGGWDWVVANELLYSYGATTPKFQEYARKFVAETRTVGARLMLFATGETESARLDVGPMYRDSLALARECGGRVAGGGMGWLKAWEKRPALDFHHTDRAHANAAGYYLNACVIYAALTDTTPVGLDPFVLSGDEAAFLQGIAWAQSQDDRRGEKIAEGPPP